nr:hypothetical protein [Tanacetum cinerariifolium]
MKEESEKLKIIKGAVGQQITSARHKRYVIIDGVHKWVKEVDADISKAEEFLVRDVNRYRYNKRESLMYLTLVEHQVSGKGYETCVSVDTERGPGELQLHIVLFLEHDILTQDSALEDIITAIEYESKQIIRIYGMGGVGKMMLAMKVGARVLNHPFDAVARVKHLFDTVRLQLSQKLWIMKG